MKTVIENNNKDSKLKISVYVRISTYTLKYIRTSEYSPSWSEKVVIIKKLKNTFPWTYFKVGLSNYAIKTDIQKATGIISSNLALKSNLAK